MSNIQIPDLKDSYQAYLQLIEPLLTTNQWQESQNRTADFVVNEGEILKQMLDTKLETSSYNQYLTNNFRTEHLQKNKAPVSLNGNLGMRINWQAKEKGYMRLAKFIYSMLLIHKDYFNDNFSNYELEKSSVEFLLGASRYPTPKGDKLYLAKPNRVLKNIGVFWQYRFYILPVMNKNNEILGAKQIYKALNELLEQDIEEAQIPFASLTFAGEDAVNLVQSLLKNSQNKQAFQQANETLFNITIKEDEVFSESTLAIDDATYGHGVELWAYKPLNYIYYIADDGLFLHAETSWAHVNTYKKLLTYAQNKYLAGEVVLDNSPFPGEAKFREISWQMENAQWHQWLMAITNFDKKLEQYAFSSINIEVERLNQTPEAYDFIMQFLMLCGQIRSLGRARNITAYYDWNNFDPRILGDMRSISRQSLNLAIKLFNQTATIADFDLAFNEHKNRESILNTGISYITHLKELEKLANRTDKQFRFFQEPGYKILAREYMISYSQIIDNIIQDVGFAPPNLNGFGINYGFTGTAWRFLISHSKANQLMVNQFMLGMEEAWQKLDALLHGEMEVIAPEEELPPNKETHTEKSSFMARFLGKKDKDKNSSNSTIMATESETKTNDSTDNNNPEDEDDDW